MYARTIQKLKPGFGGDKNSEGRVKLYRENLDLDFIVLLMN